MLKSQLKGDPVPEFKIGQLVFILNAYIIGIVTKIEIRERTILPVLYDAYSFNLKKHYACLSPECLTKFN